MASTVDIANQALLRIGAEPIIALTDDTERARAVNASWPFVRREVLRGHTWNVATTVASLPELAGVEDWEFESIYQVPPDSLRILSVNTSLIWRKRGQTIVTDGSGELEILYLRDITDSQEFDASLTDVMVLRLAAEIAERITDSPAKRNALLNEYQVLLLEAKQDDGEEQSPEEFEEDIWILARNGHRGHTGTL